MMMPRRFHTIMAASALLAGTALMAQSPQDPVEGSEQGIMQLLERAIKAKRAGDHAEALDAYEKAAAVAAQDPKQQDGIGLLLRADLQREIALATIAAGAGNPCPALDRGTDYLDQARKALSKSDDTLLAEATDGFEQQINAIRRRMRCAPSGPPVEVGRPDAALAGHYYLSGVMETGSELLLKADGRFDWYISYGAVDQVATGRWGRDGQTVTLAADLPAADTPLLRADQAMAWDEDAERRLRDVERSREEQAIAARCPWGMGVASAPSVYLREDRPPVGPAERARAARAKQAAEIARDEASRAVARAVAAGASEDDQAAADTAMSAWHSASYEMEQAHRAADLPVPDIGSPAVPPECRYPARNDEAELRREQWRRGIAALLGDPARELRLSGIGVTFVFSDGHRETAETNRGGWAFAPLRQEASVTQLIVTIPQSGRDPVTLPVTPLAEGVQPVIVDTQQLVEPPFETMVLTVQGRDLVPQDMPRGRYSRD